MGSLALHAPAGGVADAGVVVERMLGAAPHRGTERRTVQAGTVVLGVSTDPGHRDAHAASGPGRAAVVCGSLDNAAALGRELRRAGHDARDGDPASVLLAAFSAWGPEAARRLRGAFAAAVTDGTTTHVVRDQLGMRPLLVRENGHGVLAASEVKQVIAGAGLERRADPAALADA